MHDTADLLRDYSATGSETAFRQIVERHVDLVYSTAIRRVAGDSYLAQDLVQTVFTDLARISRKRREREGLDIRCLSGWLYRHTCLNAAELIRSERRRAVREQIAAEMNLLNQSTSEASWRELAPVLDDAMAELDDTDRNALVLRFFDRCDFKRVGAALGVSDDAAQKRVSRALDRLRGLLARRGINSAAAALGTTLNAHAVTVAPAELAASVVGPALAGVAGSVMTSASAGLAAEFTQFMLLLMTTKKWITLGTLIVVGVAVTPFVKREQAPQQRGSA